MHVYHSLEEYREQNRSGKRSAVTLGKFDGLHKGHLKLISDVLEISSVNDLQSVVFVIELHEKGILSHAERRSMLESMGIDILVECPFSREFMEMSPDSFARRILCDTLHASFAAVGDDYRFGFHRAGDAVTLKELGRIYGFKTDIAEKEMYLSEEISSTRVRDALTASDMQLVEALLGRPYKISGTVRHGKHLGSQYDMPTVNLLPPADKLLPKDGVYAGIVEIPDGSKYTGLTNIGFRPTVNGTHRTIETTLLDYSGDLYGADICLCLNHFIREEMKFPSMEKLREQIEKDKLTAESFYT